MSITTHRRPLRGVSFCGLPPNGISSIDCPANPDAELIALCDQFLSIETEMFLLMDHDEQAPDFGPNHARYEELGNEKDRLIEMIEEFQSPTTPAGCAAVARAALTWVTLSIEGEFLCDSSYEELMVKMAKGVAADFVWPPRPGSCSTAHWAPPTSSKEIAEHEAASAAWRAQIDARIQAEKQAAAAEQHRVETPSLMTEGELRGQLKISLIFGAKADQMANEASIELARRGLA
jgi:hypothetical protein